jgi:hypothetical protein
VPNTSADRGSQRWLQMAVNRHPELLNAALATAMGVPADDTITWASPLAADGYAEYRDGEALRRVGITDLPKRPLKEFWPARGPLWDGLARTASGRAIFVEAKAHIPEAASPGTKASPDSLVLIERSLEEARPLYVPGEGARSV